MLSATSLQLCPILGNPVDYSPPSSSVHGILQARILEWVGCHFLLQGGLLNPGFFSTSATWEALSGVQAYSKCLINACWCRKLLSSTPFPPSHYPEFPSEFYSLIFKTPCLYQEHFFLRDPRKEKSLDEPTGWNFKKLLTRHFVKCMQWTRVAVPDSDRLFTVLGSLFFFLS